MEDLRTSASESVLRISYLHTIDEYCFVICYN